MSQALNDSNIIPKLANLHISNANVVLDSSKQIISDIWISNVAGTALTHHEKKEIYRMYEYTSELVLTGSALGN